MKKEKENNKVALVIELPMPSFQPVNGRIFVKDIAGEDLKTKSGLYIPTNFTTMKGDYKQKWQHKRYFVLAVAPDVNIQ
jgi:co-chaperonin GroES (HSP10)